MLELAILHKDDLQRAWALTALDPRYQYMRGVGAWHQLALTIRDSTWEELQMVSVRDGQVIGYFEATWDRPVASVLSLAMGNFEPKPSATFAHDAAKFYRSLFVDWRQFAVRWWVAVGNPAEELYDRLIEKHGGRVSGYERQALLLPNQIRVDRKRYEALASEVKW